MPWLLPSPPQIGQLLRQGEQMNCSPRHGAGFDFTGLAGVLGLSATRAIYHHCIPRGTGNLKGLMP